MITNLERQDSNDLAVRIAIEGALKSFWTAMPAIVQKLSNGHTMTAQATINGIQRQFDGTLKNAPLPPFDDVPVHFPGGGGVTATHPVATGDEGLVVFASRNQDSWHQSGGTNNDPMDARTYHLADGRWIPGGRSDPRKMNPPPSTSSHQTRSDDGNHVSDVHPQNGITHSSTAKHLVIVGGSSGAGTLHLPEGKIIKNAAKVLINTVTADGLPPPGLTIANKKLVAGTPLPAAGPQASSIASVMASVLSGGLGALFSDPTAAANTGLSGAATSGAAALTIALGGAAATMVAALTGGGGLASALSTLQTGTGNLSGATAPTLPVFGLNDILNHAANLTQYFGAAAPPTSVALATVLAPLQSSSTLTGLQTSLNALVASVIAGSTTVAAGTTSVNGMNTTVSALMTNANAALTTLQTGLPALALAAAAGTAGISQDSNVMSVFTAASNTGLAALAADFAAIVAPSTADLAAIVSFPDASATQAGARGGL
jgi:hypothetical protein